MHRGRVLIEKDGKKIVIDKLIEQKQRGSIINYERYFCMIKYKFRLRNVEEFLFFACNYKCEINRSFHISYSQRAFAKIWA